MAASDSFYYELQEEVVGVLRDFGTEYNIVTPGQYDEETMVRGPETARVCQGIVADQQFASQLAPNGWTATKTLILPHDANPAQGEEVVVDGKPFALSKVVPVKPADVVVCYLLDVTR
ncbi:MAG: hypothetical protein ACRDCY_18130 [Aeromonas veronii]